MCAQPTEPPSDQAETYTLDQAAEALGVSVDDLRTYIDEDLVRPSRGEGGEVVFSRADMRRLWSVVTLHRDLGINLPGVSAVLRLREQYERVRRDLATLVEIVERELGPDAWDRLWPADRPAPRPDSEQAAEAPAAGTDAGQTGPKADPAPDEPAREPP